MTLVYATGIHFHHFSGVLLLVYSHKTSIKILTCTNQTCTSEGGLWNTTDRDSIGLSLALINNAIT